MQSSVPKSPTSDCSHGLAASQSKTVFSTGRLHISCRPSPGLQDLEMSDADPVKFLAFKNNLIGNLKQKQSQHNFVTSSTSWIFGGV